MSLVGQASFGSLPRNSSFTSSAGRSEDAPPIFFFFALTFSDSSLACILLFF